jgi:hypothetical protein
MWRRMACANTGREMYQVGMLGKGHLFEEVWAYGRGYVRWAWQGR